MLTVIFSSILVAYTPVHSAALNIQKPSPSVSTYAAIKKKRPRCKDKKDNDKDGLIDYPNDPGCKNRRDNNEKNTVSNPDNPIPDLGDGASLNGKRPFPDDNPWNKDISAEPIDPRSDQIIASIGANDNLHPDFGTFWDGGPIGIPYVVVSGSQSKSNVSFYYGDESDKGPYPIPDNPPIEGGDNSDGDRHILMIDRDNWKLYELFDARKVGGLWEAGSGAIFDLSSNSLRPAGWTSADAAGLPIFPGLVRYDEVMVQKEIRHALRFTVSRSRKAYVSPARHWASSSEDSSLPPMGMRVKLKASVDISSYSGPVQVILRALKKYGMMVADNGSDWFISGAHDPRWNDDELSEIKSLRGRDFEVIEMKNIQTSD